MSARTALQGALKGMESPTPADARQLQRKCACADNGQTCSRCASEKLSLQREAGGSPASGYVPPIVYDVVSSPGQPLDKNTRGFMEPRFGEDFSNVRIHTDSRAAESAQGVSAIAYTVGPHIVFGANSYHPASSGGRRLLAHELAHVVQSSGAETAGGPIAFEANPSSAPEREAERAADDVVGGRSPRIVTRSAGGRLRRQPIVDEPAGGCGFCKSPTLVGSEVHDLIQAAFPVTYQNEARFTLPAPPWNRVGILDLLHITLSPENPPSTVEVGEIKPNNVQGVKDGAADLSWYMTQLRARLPPPPHWEVEPMLVAPPVIETPYHDGVSASCPTQTVTAINSGGIYLYSCLPTRGTVGTSCCHPTPPPVPVQEESKEDVKEKEKKKDEEKEKETDKPPLGQPVPGFARDAAWWTAMTAALAAGGYVLSKVGGAARGRAMAYVTVIAAVILIANGAEASVGLEGDDAFEALLKLADAKGQTIPEDVREAMRNDPELRRILTKAVRSGNYDEAQKQAGDRLARVIADHKNEFTEEELAVLLEATESMKGSVPSADVTVQELKNAIEAKKKGATLGAGTSATKGEDVTEGGETKTPTISGAATLLPGATPEERLANGMARREPEGIVFSASLKEKIIETARATQPPLTDKEVEKLLKQVTSAAGKSEEEVLESVRNGINMLRAGKKGEEGNGAGEARPEEAKPEKTKKSEEGSTSLKVPVNLADPAKPQSKADQAVIDVVDKHIDKMDWIEDDHAYLAMPAARYDTGKTYQLLYLGRDKSGVAFMGSVFVTIHKKDASGWRCTIAGGAALYTKGRRYGTTRTSTDTITPPPHLTGGAKK